MQELQKREYTHFGNSDQENNQLRHLSLCYLFTQDVISIINLHHNCVSLISRIRFPRRRQKYLYYQIEPYGYGLRKNPLYAYEGQTPAVAERLQHQFITDRSVSQILLRKKCKQQMGQLTYLGNKRDRQYFLVPSHQYVCNKNDAYLCATISQVTVTLSNENIRMNKDKILH